MTQSDPITASLERFGALCADPAPLIYQRLFARHPDFEELFAMDTDGGVRGSMLTTCFECIIGLAEGSPLPRFELQSARLSHQGYGVPEAKLDDMFTAIRDTCRDTLAGEWTPAMEAAWAAVLAEIASMGHAPA